MFKKYVIIIVTLVLAGGVVAGAWYVMGKPVLRDSGLPPITQPNSHPPTIQKISEQVDTLPELPFDVQYDLTTWPHYRLQLDNGEWVVDTEPGREIIEASRVELQRITEDDPYVRVSSSTHVITFCNKVYQVSTILVQGTNIMDWLVQHVVPKDYGLGICGNITHGNENGFLPLTITRVVTGGYHDDTYSPLRLHDGVYTLKLGLEPIEIFININSGRVYVPGGYSGEGDTIGEL